MSPLSDDGSETLPPDALRRLVVDLSQRLGALEAQVAELRDELEKTEMARATLQAENQDLRDEIARLKNLPPRPPFKPSGMEKATNREPGKPSGKRRPRGPKRDTDRVTREEVLIAKVPAGSRFKGYETCLVRELVISAELVRYRRERWLTPEGKTIIAPLPEGLLGGFGANLRRFCLALHAQGQVTTERLTAILNGIGMDISKRQVVRILTSDLDGFVAEDQAILRSGLATAPYISVDDTGARHAHRDGITTQIGGTRFSVFRTGRSKSRLNFLSLLRAGGEDYVINDAALDYMRQRKVAPDVIGKLAAHPETSFASQMAWYDHLVRLRLDVFDRTLVREITGAALWGAVRHHGLMGNTVVVSDDAGQFRIPNHALCWVHAERLLQKLMPKTPEQTRKLETVPVSGANSRAVCLRHIARQLFQIAGARTSLSSVDQLPRNLPQLPGPYPPHNQRCKFCCSHIRDYCMNCRLHLHFLSSAAIRKRRPHLAQATCGRIQRLEGPQTTAARGNATSFAYPDFG
ncbi:hypothetical protein [Paracoccus actinidiae]|uniref:hypothetical protein n=1 Tax=Paracoccus actinidiae TaxID=3064531 RepID=UPI0027D2C811|nr:hypothetical protein [Paracoccus sp. M09]